MKVMRRRAGRRRTERTGAVEAFVQPDDRGGDWAARTQATPAAATTLRAADGGTQARVLRSLQGTSGNAAVQRLFGFGEDEEDEAETNEVGSTSGPIEQAPAETFAREQPAIEGPVGGSSSPRRERVGGQGIAEEESIEGVSEEQTSGPGEEATPGVSEEQTSGPGEEATPGVSEEQTTGPGEEATPGVSEEQTSGPGEEATTGVSEEQTTGADGTAAAPQDLADRVHAAGEGFGTDEAALFAALRSLGRDAAAIAALKATFAGRFSQTLEGFLRDELSGVELDEALVLITA